MKRCMKERGIAIEGWRVLKETGGWEDQPGGEDGADKVKTGEAWQ